MPLPVTVPALEINGARYTSMKAARIEIVARLRSAYSRGFNRAEHPSMLPAMIDAAAFNEMFPDYKIDRADLAGCL